MKKNCVDCIFYLGGKNCELHEKENDIRVLLNNKCTNYKEKKDEVKNRTGHYTVGGIEPFDVHKSMGIFSEFAKGNIIKYTMRQGKKLGEDINDLKKIVDYALSLALYEGVNPEDLKGIFEDRIKRHKKEGN